MLLSLPFAVGGVNLFGYLILVVAPFIETWRQAWHRLVTNRMAGIALLMLGMVAVGTLYSLGGSQEALNVLNRYHKLLFIPWLMPFFCRDEDRVRALHVLALALSINVAISWTEYLGLTHVSDPIYDGVAPGHFGDNVFRTHIAQGLLFDVLLVIAGVHVIRATGRIRYLFAIIGLLTALNILVVMVGRTGKALLPVILLWLLYEWLTVDRAFFRIPAKWKSMALLLGVLVMAGTTWSLAHPSTMLGTIVSEVRASRATGVDTSQGERVQFWQKGFRLIRLNPWYGSGAGSVHAQTLKLAQHETSFLGRMATYNLHDEFLMWAVQFGFPGLFVIVLFFMYYLSAAPGSEVSAITMRGAGLVFLIGCLFNSFLMDFTEGYSMVLLAGVLARL